MKKGGYHLEIDIIVLYIVALVIFSAFIYMSILFFKQFSTGKKEDALPPIVVEAMLVEKSETRRASDGKTTHYATFAFENGDRQEFWIDWIESRSLEEGSVGQLSYRGTKYRDFEPNP